MYNIERKRVLCEKKGSVMYESYFRLCSNCFWLNIIRVLFSVFMRTYIFETSVSEFKAICPAENVYVIRNVSLNILSMCHEEQCFQNLIYFLWKWCCSILAFFVSLQSMLLTIYHKKNYCVFSCIHLVMVHGHVF